MLKSLLKLLPTSIGKREEKVSISAASVPDGYHEPEQAAKLLASPQRRQWLQTLWDYKKKQKNIKKKK